MMIRERLRIAEANAAKMTKIVARFAQIVDASRAFVDAQSRLAQGDFAGDKFDELERAVRALFPKEPPC